MRAILTFILCLLSLGAFGQSAVGPASQAEVNAGTIRTKYVSPQTLNRSPAGAARILSSSPGGWYRTPLRKWDSYVQYPGQHYTVTVTNLYTDVNQPSVMYGLKTSHGFSSNDRLLLYCTTADGPVINGEVIITNLSSSVFSFQVPNAVFVNVSNSVDVLDLTTAVSEVAVTNTAWTLLQNGYKQFGWNTLQISEWATYIDANGLLRANSNNFPNGIEGTINICHNLGFNVVLFMSLNGTNSPSGNKAVPSTLVETNAAYWVSVGADGFMLADDSNAYTPSSISDGFWRFASTVRTNMRPIYLQGSYHTRDLPEPWVFNGLDASFLVGTGLNPGGVDTYDYILAPSGANMWTNSFTLADAVWYPHRYMVKPGHFFSGQGMAGESGSKFNYQVQAGVSALFNVGLTAFSFPGTGAYQEEADVQTNSLLYTITTDSGMYAPEYVNTNGNVYCIAKYLGDTGQYVVGFWNRHTAAQVGTLYATNLGWFPNTSFSLNNVWTNTFATNSVGSWSISCGARELALYLVKATGPTPNKPNPSIGYVDLLGSGHSMKYDDQAIHYLANVPSAWGAFGLQAHYFPASSGVGGQNTLAAIVPPAGATGTTLELVSAWLTTNNASQTFHAWQRVGYIAAATANNPTILYQTADNISAINFTTVTGTNIVWTTNFFTMPAANCYIQASTGESATTGFPVSAWLLRFWARSY